MENQLIDGGIYEINTQTNYYLFRRCFASFHRLVKSCLNSNNKIIFKNISFHKPIF